ncbi:MAG: uroporphyrinogen decarboxylase family protein, partial [Candidatus Aminicenantales bacterium]
MTKRERVERTYAFEPADKPPFVPAIYEHKARLIGRSPSEVCRSLDLLLEALDKELEVYDPDVLTVGVDVYNVEAEAVGCEVRYFGSAPDVPAVAAPILKGRGGLGGLRRPDPGGDGRMPLLIEAAARLERTVGSGLIVRGAVTGPFSLACALAGTEEVLVATLEDPGFVRDLVAFSA